MSLGNKEILDFLSPDYWISGEEIASQLGISRAAVWKQIQSLKAKGYEIDSATNRGYRLARKIDLISPEIILQGLQIKTIGRDLRYFFELESTNNFAKSIAFGCADGTVILAETQTNGRGRLSRLWISPPGGIWMSLVLKPPIPLSNFFRINMAVSTAICRVFFDLYGLKANIKWPNDLLINEKKICGILTEVSAEMDKLDYAVVGIGINANVDVSGFPDQWMATSLSCELGHDISRKDLIQKLIEEIDVAYAGIDSSELFAEWCLRSGTLGKYVRISSILGDVEGEVTGLAEDGALCLRTQEGDIRVLAGDCVHLRTLNKKEKEEAWT